MEKINIKAIRIQNCVKTLLKPMLAEAEKIICHFSFQMYEIYFGSKYRECFFKHKM